MAADSPPCILVVEDDPGIAVLQRRRLQRAGFRTEVASHVDAALSALSRGDVALVLLDYRLGETTGLDLHRRMKAAGIEVPVILVSASMEDAVVTEALRAGVRDVVVKTADYLEHLPDAVRVVLDQTAGVPLYAGPQRATCVLIAEDDPGVAALQRRRLERAGYDVRVTATAEEALHVLRDRNVALAVLDLRLADATGLELYERAKGEGLAVPAILVTGFPDQAVAIQALRAGIRDFVTKSPEYLDYLPKAVERVISQVAVERKLAESELRLASIIGTTLDAIVMCDERSQIVLFNRSAEEMFGCPANEALARPLTAFIPELTLTRTDTGQRLRERRELDGVRADATRMPLDVSVSGVTIDGRRLLTVIARDITERRRAEEELREADRRKDEFLGMLGHELRNPLAAIMNAGEVLHLRLAGNRTHRLVDVIRRQTKTLARMVDDLLDVSRVTLGKIQLTREPTLVNEVVARSVEAMREAITRADLSVESRIDPEPLWVDGDPTRLEQVVTNLLTNAVKFTPAAGRILVDLRAESQHGVLRVRDTGIGIPAPLLPRVFDLFVQGDTSLDRARSGLGIGLSLVRQLVVLHGGTVSARSDGPGAGSEFTVRLPLVPQRSKAARADELPGGAGGRSLRILVVDDQPDVADAVAMLIDAFGHRAHAVYDPAAALDRCRHEAPDAMFVDIGMPGMTGYELAEEIRRDPALRHLPLVALTGYGRDEDRVRVREAGFNLHITKPVTDAALQAALAAIAGR